MQTISSRGDAPTPDQDGQPGAQTTHARAAHTSLQIGAESAEGGDGDPVIFADRLAAQSSESTQSASAIDAARQDAPLRPGAGESPGAGVTFKATLGATTKADPGVVQAEAADDRAAVTSVNRGLAAVVRQRGGSVTIRLAPESLGPLRIQMSIEGGRVDLRFDASTDQARELLHRHADALRQSLESRGLGVERVQVYTSPPGGDASDGRSAQQRQDEQAHQRHDAGREQSRGFFDRRTGEQQDGRAWRERPDAFTTAWRVALNATA